MGGRDGDGEEMEGGREGAMTIYVIRIMHIIIHTHIRLQAAATEWRQNTLSGKSKDLFNTLHCSCDA